MKKVNVNIGTGYSINQTYEAEGLEMKIRRMMEGKEGIEEAVPLIYTDKKDGVLPGYDIRTDRFEVALNAMDKLRQAEVAKIAKGNTVDPGQAAEAKGGTEPMAGQS